MPMVDEYLGNGGAMPASASPEKDGFYPVVLPALPTQLVIRGSLTGARGDLWFWTARQRPDKIVVVSARHDTTNDNWKFFLSTDVVEVGPGLNYFDNEAYIHERFMAAEGILRVGVVSPQLIYVLDGDRTSYGRRKIIEPEDSLRLRDHVVRAHFLLGMALVDPSRIYRHERDEFVKEIKVFRLLHCRMSGFVDKQFKKRNRVP